MKNTAENVVIIDIGLQTKAEHSFALAQRLQAELLAREIHVEIYGNAKLETAIVAKLKAIPHFKRGMYQFAPNPIRARIYRLFRKLRITTAYAPPSEVTTAQRYNDQFREDLTALPAQVFENVGICLFPGLFQNQILGLARYVAENHQKISAKIVCVLMFPPTWTTWGKVARNGPQVYAEAFNLLKPFIGSKVFFACENQAIAALFKNQFNIKVGLLPIPLGENAVISTDKKDHICIGFMGNSKREKGFHLLPEAIKICCENRADLKFLIQVNPEPGDCSITETIRKICASPNTRTIEGPLTSKVYKDESDKIDIVLLPYDPIQFGMRGSGVFTETVSGGRLTVATQGTWAAQEIINQKAAGEVFESYNSQSLAEAILRLCNRNEVARLLAIKLASENKGKNSPAEYVDRLLALAQ